MLLPTLLGIVTEMGELLPVAKMLLLAVLITLKLPLPLLTLKDTLKVAEVPLHAGVLAETLVMLQVIGTEHTPVTCTGTLLSVVVPFPTCPNSFLPQAQTVPLFFMASECEAPPEMAIMPVYLAAK